MKLKGKKALVTGGSKGIGKGIVSSFLTQGAEVFTFSRSEDDLKKMEKEFERLPGKLHCLKVDACSGEDVDHMISHLQSQWSELDILVNSLGGVPVFGSVFELAEEDFQYAFELNVMAFVRIVKKTIPLLRSAKNGKIINISSISGVQPGYYNPHYALTKAATINLGKYFANILSKERIAVNTICPGPVHTDSWERGVDHFARKNKERLSKEESRAEMESMEAAKVPLGRVGEPEDIAGLVVYLASEESNWITGSCFHVNGGKLASAF